MHLVEVVKTDETDPAIYARALEVRFSLDELCGGSDYLSCGPTVCQSTWQDTSRVQGYSRIHRQPTSGPVS